MITSILLSACGSSSSQQQDIRFGNRGWSLPIQYHYQQISTEDIGDDALYVQGFIQTEGESGDISDTVMIVLLDTSYIDSSALRDAVQAGLVGLMGYDDIDTESVAIDCGEDGTEDIQTSRFSFQRGPFDDDHVYYVTQAYLVRGEQSSIVSYLGSSRKDAKVFLDNIENIYCL